MSLYNKENNRAAIMGKKDFKEILLIIKEI